MSSISNKLKSLGVQIGARDLPPPRPRATSHSLANLEAILLGHTLETPLGEAFLIDTHYPPEYLHGRVGLKTTSSLQILSTWAGEQRIQDFPPHTFAYLDTETTGLNGGTGTYAFLIGVGRFEGDTFHLAQFFMRDPLEEPAQLAALEQFIAPCQALVTFNGKAFDIPLLNARYTTHGWQTPFTGTAHVDLLHLARRLWRDRLPSRTLGNLEVQILGAIRTEDDLPGWLIPSRYFDYLRDGDPLPLKNVIYHNAMDVVAMAALFNYMAAMLADPLSGNIEHGSDLIALAKLYEDLGELDYATRLYLHGLDHDLSNEVLLDAIQRLAALHKRQDNYQAAVELWEQAARHQHLEAHIELAKFYEHRLRSYPEAIYWTQTAIELLLGPRFPLFERRQRLLELEHRLARLQHKVAGQAE